jgi:Holliday junction resolvasome RuvABC endonuclease subunit
MHQSSNPFRIVAISLSSRGFGYAVMERNRALVDYGKKVVSEDKNAWSLAHIAKLIAVNRPDVLALQSMNAKGTRRALRIKELHRSVVMLVKKYKIRVVELTGTELRNALLGNPNATKHEMAEVLAKQFPDELASRLPPKRKAWASEDSRMDVFDAVALAVAFQEVSLR